MPTAPTLSDDLLASISEAKPAGEDLRPTSEWDKIKDARRSDDTQNLDKWVPRDIKTANWGLVQRLASQALATKTKDLQIAIWLTEASLKLQGFAGLRDSLRLIRELLIRFWDQGLFPPIEEGDLEFRAGALEWLNEKLAFLVQEIPLTVRSDGGEDYGWHRLAEARRVGREQDLVGPSGDVDVDRQARRQADLADGKISMEMFEAASGATRRAPYEVFSEDFEQACRELEELDRIVEEKFGNEAPAFTATKAALEECREPIQRIREQKRQEEPDPAPLAELGEAAGEAGGAVRIGLPVEPQDREDALRRVVAVAAYLRQNDPYSPASYLLTRALRWGELRARGRPPDAGLCVAPNSQTRQKLRQLFLEEQWNELLEQAEAAAAGEEGRAWLDLQRYTFVALSNLGYEMAAEALKSELRALLQGLPELPSTSLLDDTAAASAETQTWLRETVLSPAQGSASGQDAGPAEVVQSQAWEQARQLATSGRLQQGLAEMNRLAAAETSGRTRFLRKLQLAEICFSLKQEALALPLLEELGEQIDQRLLDSWESAELVGRVWGWLYRCYNSGRGSPAAPEQATRLFARLCRLDPAQAFLCAEQ